MANEFIIKNGLIVKDITYPITDGTSGQVIVTDGNGVLSFGDASGIQNVVEDTTPQLGGSLDTNANEITGTGRIALSSTNNIVRSSYSDVASIPTTNSGLVAYTTAEDGLFYSNGSAWVQVATKTLADSKIADIVEDTTPQLGGSLDVNGNIITTSTLNGDITLTPNGTGNVVLSGLSYPTADGSSNQVLTTDGSGNLSWTTKDNQSVFTTITGDTGSLTADETNEALAIIGGSDIETTLSGNTLSIAFTGTASGEVNQNAFSNVAVSGQTTIAAETTTDTLNIASSGTISLTTNALTDTLTISSSAEINQNAFSNIAVSGQTTVAADSTTDTLTFVSGDGVSITTDDSTNSVTITNTTTAQNLFETIVADSGSKVASTTSDSITISGGTDITTSISSNTLTIDYSGSAEANQNAFSTVSVDGVGTISSDSTTDTLNIVAGSNMTIAVDDSTNTMTLSSAASGGSTEVTDGTTTVSASTINFSSGATVTDAGSGVANVAISGGSGSGVFTVERVKINFTGTDLWSSYENLTSGVVATNKSNTAATDIVTTFTFTGYTLPPANILYYGFNASQEYYSFRYVPLGGMNLAPSTSGDPNAPNTFGSFSTIELTTTVNNMGGNSKTGLPTIPAHGYIIFIMQG